MKKSKFYSSYNAAYIQELYERFRRDPDSVDPEWRGVLAALSPREAGLAPVSPAEAGPGAAPPARAGADMLRAAVASAELVDAYRLHGHRSARLDPLGSTPPGHPMLDPAFHGISDERLRDLSASILGLELAGPTMLDVLGWLRETYTGTIGYEFEHIEDPERREWLRARIETGEDRTPLGGGHMERLLERLTEVEALEQFLHRAYLGKKRFSVEGNDMMVPMLDLAIERAATAGAREVVLGMAHRGRLNVLAHVLGRPYSMIIAEFEGGEITSGTTGDVKYHLGAEGTYATASGEPLTVTLAPNPSHLEAVDPIVEGMARAKQSHRDGRSLDRDEDAVLPVLIHGDAAFAAQGIVTETLNLSELDGYRTGGTLHLIANNQIGFTTEPGEGRSTHYASDVARGLSLPVFHVNADDPAACLAVVRLALAYRARFHDDVVIDLVGYRKFGHNEGDEPAYTQPRMYAAIDEHPSVREQWADRLVEDGVMTREQVDALRDETYQRLIDAQDAVKRQAEQAPAESVPPSEPATIEASIDTTVSADLLRSLDRQLHAWPDDFGMNPKLQRQLERRSKSIPDGKRLDWAHAEALAFGSLLAEAVPVRLSGQDSERGTFSQRHLAFHDVETGEGYRPIAHLNEASAPFEVYNSPLSEQGVLGFEYGYSVAAPGALVLWEAQFGDFVNGAQVIIDQFLTAGRAKWGQTAHLVLLLPHGYEGQGPEHSSGRMERFLQLAAEDNIRVANATTPAQYFHLLRRQALLEERRPLIVFTPKSLLRHPRAMSSLEALADGEFHHVLDDPDADDHRGDITRVALCTGKVYYDLVGSEHRDRAAGTAVVRVEHLYPFPERELAKVVDRYPSAKELVWTQEEPENMGAWRYMEPRLRALFGDRLELGYAGRPERASPAEGYAHAHAEQQAELVEAALTGPVSPPRHVRTAEKPRTH